MKKDELLKIAGVMAVAYLCGKTVGSIIGYKFDPTRKKEKEEKLNESVDDIFIYPLNDSENN